MTINEIHIAIDVEVDKSLDFEYPYILPEVKDYWLNKAQENIINQKISGNNIKNSTYDLTLERMIDLKNIVRTVSIAGTPNIIFDYMETYLLPSDFKYYVKSFVTLQKLKADNLSFTGDYSVDILTKQLLENYLTVDGLHKPDLDSLKGSIDTNKLDVVYDSYMSNIENLKLIYLKEPIKFDYVTGTVSELDNLHYQIIDEAVLLILGNIESPRIQQQAELNKRNE